MLRLRFEVDYASRMDGRPDAPGEDAAASLAEKQEQLAEAQAAVQVLAFRLPTCTERAFDLVASRDLATLLMAIGRGAAHLPLTHGRLHA